MYEPGRSNSHVHGVGYRVIHTDFLQNFNRNNYCGIEQARSSWWSVPWIFHQNFSVPEAAFLRTGASSENGWINKYRRRSQPLVKSRRVDNRLKSRSGLVCGIALRGWIALLKSRPPTIARQRLSSRPCTEARPEQDRVDIFSLVSSSVKPFSMLRSRIFARY